MIATTPRALAAQMLGILEHDLPVLKRIDRYLEGKHDDPYMPARADAEYRLLAKRAVTNMSLILVGTPAQALYVDNYRRGGESRPADGEVLPEWRHWQESRLDARQTAVHRAALAYGHSFVLTEKTRAGKVRSKGLSPLRTVAVYEDPANDDAPIAAITVTQWPKPGGDDQGIARMWDGKREYAVTFVSLTDPDSVAIQGKKSHGASECPVTRFAACVDLEGRTLGVVEPMIALQNRINQTVFDLLVAQTYGSFVVRTATGMAPPLKTRPVYQKGQEPYSFVDSSTSSAGRDALGQTIDRDGWVLDESGQRVIVDTAPVVDPVTGQHVYQQVDINARRFLFAKDKDAKWGSLDATPLGGFIDSVDMSIRHLSALAQVPPHHLLGQIANLSAEALQAAETALARKVEEFRKVFGESWERVFRLAGELSGDASLASNFLGEVIWRDMEMKSLGAIADGLGKMAEQLGIPRRGLWPRVPNVTRQELEDWHRILKEDSPEDQMIEALVRATPTGDTPAPVEE